MGNVYLKAKEQIINFLNNFKPNNYILKRPFINIFSVRNLSIQHVSMQHYANSQKYSVIPLYQDLYKILIKITETLYLIISLQHL
jgi:hypothetical protein